ncbi:MAG: hypothetical protein HYW78_00620 [Parcubacteria group bacterium]|nr:hypothetical protein [Parcubacteria group bacterium]
MGIQKYKYYFKQPRIEIMKDILSVFVISGTLIIAGNSPYFVRNLWRAYTKFKRYSPKKISSAFYRLRKNGLVSIEKKNHQIYISLTEEGRKKAGIYQINHLKVTRQKRWDKKWRLLIFDIPHKIRIVREALRGKIKQMGFYQLQKSIWIYPFDCQPEIELLCDFFGLSAREIRLIVADTIGDDREAKKYFGL